MDGLMVCHDILKDVDVARINGALYELPKAISNDRPSQAFPYQYDERGIRYAKAEDILSYGHKHDG